HLRQDLVQRLLALVVPAEGARAAARPADGVDLVDEDDRGRHLPGLAEQLSDPARADADDHLDELGGARAEDRYFALAGGGAGEQRLAGAGRAGQQAPLRRAGAEPAVLVRVLEKIDHLVDLGLDLV